MPQKTGFHGQVSDSFRAALFLILSGGFQDAYTYCNRGRVFANAQTGNIVLMSTHLFEGQWGEAVKYLIPLAAFILGTVASEWMHVRLKGCRRLHWRQTVLLLEMGILLAVPFLPHGLDPLANGLVSLYAPCSSRPSIRSGATPMPAPCASATCAAAQRLYVPICTPEIKPFCTNP